MLSKKRLCAGISLAAFNAALAVGPALLVGSGVLLAPSPAAAVCLSVNTDTSINTGSTSCLSWTGANLTVTNNGILSTTGQPALTSSGTVGTLTNSGTIASTTVGIQNNGLVGSIVNNATGSISGATGLSNAGTITALTNSGTITGTAKALDNASGTIGNLTNSGTISSNGIAINLGNTGSIGTLTNSGLIAGSIQSSSSNNLTINGGGSASAWGTLTGASGGIGSADRGTIVSGSADLVFASGFLLLNDNISVPGQTVSITGATVRLDNTITISGSYNESGGALFSTATGSGASYGFLTVSGNATITNSTITISGAGLSAGQTFTIVQAGVSGSYTNDTATVAVTNGLGATVSTSGRNLIVTLTSSATNTYAAKGTQAGGVAAPVGKVLDTARADTGNATAVAFTNDVLTTLDALPSASQGAAIKQLAPTQNVPAAQMSFAATTAVLGAVEQHQQSAMAYDPRLGAAAGSEAHTSALWGQFLGGGADRGTTSEADGYTLHDFGVTTGIEHRFSDDLMGGAAVSWMKAWSAGRDNSSGSSSIMNSYQLTLYGTYRVDHAFVDGQLGAGFNEFDQKRAINFLDRLAQADYSGQQYLAKTTVGYDIPMTGPLDGVTVTPLASLSWLHSITDAYSETNAGTANLTVARSTTNGVSQELGGKVSWDVATDHGKLTPELRLAWVHDYTDAPIATNGVIGGESFAVTTPRTDPDGARIGAAVTLSGDDALSFRLEYDGELREQYQSHTGLLKAVWGF